MAKSNGIKSLKQAAKLLNKHSPDGESLAYINPEEARVLRARGGSGITTLAGVPSYISLSDIWKGVQNVGSSILGRYTDPEKGGGNVIKDLASLWGGYEGMKESKELSEWEKQLYEEQRAKEALNEIRFAQQTDSGAQLLAPENVPSTISDVAAYRPIDFSGSATPDLTTTAVAQGGRIGAFNGGIQGLMPQQGFMPQPRLDPRMGYAAQGGRIGYATQGFVGSTPEEGSIGFEEKIIHPGTLTEGDINMPGQPTTEFKHEGAEAQDQSELMQIAKIVAQLPTPLNPYHVWKTMKMAGVGIREAIEIVKNKFGEKETIDETMMFAQGGRIGAQGGGIMPLLDMGGMEKDYRQDGGFVPIGRREKADDVPARLSKNEFVFTADAVKAAGGGDIDEGAQRMYNVMKNLEAGGEISQQSQGQA
jgi:hypothetical protein